MNGIILGRRNQIISNNYKTMADPFSKELEKTDGEGIPSIVKDINEMSVKEIAEHLKERVSSDVSSKFIDAGIEEYDAIMKKDPKQFMGIINKALTESIEAKIHAGSKKR